ncbi:ABC transporter substrate-binding protein [Variovorax sp. Sphag1AA]|uniref:ABC transporter substrate-binding protein n=1 Tax=Variovorax sp. Sphag1AA TaxID=2587027 RepID=UPI00161EAF0B|nr:ABC transporter substrate-binding protein [Variovorax sp. Sphag1AA]MBB3178387.1 ABC-type nitrate/sulfonate/bicarbonate transport system substrate-binding protein [Variovorax sp. Sphag1AA]
MTGSTSIAAALPRRQILLGGAALAAGFAMPAFVRAQGSKQQLKLSIGRIPWAAGNSPMTQYMINNKLLEKRAADFGYDLTIDWREYPTALPMVEAMVGNNLDIGMWGNTPIIRAISSGLPISPIVVGEGHLRFLITTRNGSPIRNAQALKGKTIGVSLGGDPQSALTQMLKHELGVQDVAKEAGIRYVNMPTHAQAASVPTGVDATCTISPAFYAAQASGTVAIMNSFGQTEDYYEGPAGKGAGILLPSVKKSQFYPDGYYLHRSFWIGRNALIEQHPQAVVAFIVAQQEAVAALSVMDPGAVSQLVKDYWKLDATQGAKVVKDDVLFSRGWSWPTEKDALAILESSRYMADNKQIEKPLPWDKVRTQFQRTAPLVKQAYEKLGSKPAASEFTRTDVSDLRGRPVWEIDKWANPA